MGFSLKTYIFSQTEVDTLGVDERETNWPVIYQIFNKSQIYIGETTNLKTRMSQHMQNNEKNMLDKFSVVYDDTFNKSVALDLEAQLIQWFSGEGRYTVTNKNYGIADRDYYQRAEYRKQFTRIWEELRREGIANDTIKSIENSGLFKFSPYKSLNDSQLQTVEAILLKLSNSLAQNAKSISIIGGNEGTGKTIVLMYLAKLLRDLQDYNLEYDDEVDTDSHFDAFFKDPLNSRFKNKSIALVIPSQSLRGSVAKVLKNISNMTDIEVLSPIDFGSNNRFYDIVFVDEAHLLKMTNQEVHKANRDKVDEIGRILFGDNKPHTELDWILRKSKNVVMVFGDQRVRPNNITKDDFSGHAVHEYVLKSQMRSKGGELYIDYLRQILSDERQMQKQQFDKFEFKLYRQFGHMVGDIQAREREFGLSRLAAGFAWPWRSKKDRSAADIKIDDIELQWNSVLDDWVGSKNSINEVGSIYTIQGYDLNYCGVIIGNDLRYDTEAQKIILSKKDYHDAGAKKRNKRQLDAGIEITDDELLDQVKRVYRILMNRSVRGTYIYVCDDALRDYLSRYIDVIG